MKKRWLIGVTSLLFIFVVVVVVASIYKESESNSRSKETNKLIFVTGIDGLSYNADDYIKGNKVVALPSPIRDGYTFIGWFVADEKIEIGYEINGEIEVSAKWSANQYTINFELNGGDFTQEITVLPATFDNLITIPYPQKSGSYFAGWTATVGETAKTSRDGTGFGLWNGTLTTNAYFKNLTAENNGTVTLVANWNTVPQSYEILYYIDGVEDGTLSPNSYVEGSEFTLPTPQARIGYTFSGWYLNSDFSGSLVTQITSEMVGIKQFYGKFNVITYNISYYIDSVLDNSLSPSNFTVENSTNLPQPTKRGYSFSGWYDNADYSGETITDLNAGSIGDKFFYGKFDIINYKIYYYIDGVRNTTFTPTSYTILEVLDLPTPTKIGYTFDGWKTRKTGEVIDKVGTKIFGNPTRLDAVFAPISYSINYNLDGGNFSSSPTNTLEYDAVLEIPSVSKNEYTFVDGRRQLQVYLIQPKHLLMALRIVLGMEVEQQTNILKILHQLMEQVLL